MGMLGLTVFCTSVVAGLSNAASNNAELQWGGNLRTQAHEIGLLKARNKALVDQISNLTKSHQVDNRALQYAMEKLHPRAELADKAQAEVLQLRANAKSKDQTETALVAQLRQKTELYHSTNENLQRLENELHQLRAQEQEHARMYSELSDEKKRIEDQFKGQIRHKDKEIREMRLFSKNAKFEHKLPNPAEMGRKEELAFFKTKPSNQQMDILAKPHSLKAQNEKDIKPHQLHTLSELSSAKGANVVQFIKSNSLQKKAKMDHVSKSDGSHTNAHKRVEKVQTRRQEKEKDLRKGEQRAQLARETIAHAVKNGKASATIKLNATNVLLPKGLKWLSEVYKNKTSKFVPSAV